ncbi:hypothetical protein ACIBSW_06785 [Actinoplanes sp. NPDC049668]
MLHLSPSDVDQLTYAQVHQAVEQLDELKRKQDAEAAAAAAAEN